VRLERDRCKEIRSSPGAGGLRAVAVTGFISGVQRPEIAAAGLEDLVPKPIDTGRLLEVADRALGRGDAARERMRRAPRVLLVDDDPLRRYRAAAFLAGAGLQTLEAGSAGEAVEMARGVRPDAVLSRCSCTRIKRTPRAAATNCCSRAGGSGRAPATPRRAQPYFEESLSRLERACGPLKPFTRAR
jgi:CheY-like chemotaxis protein